MLKSVQMYGRKAAMPPMVPKSYVMENLANAEMIKGAMEAAQRAAFMKDENVKVIVKWMELVKKGLVSPAKEAHYDVQISRQEHRKVTRMNKEELEAWMKDQLEKAFMEGKVEGYSDGSADMAVSFDMAARDEFGFGKQRTKRLNEKANNELACILGDWATRIGMVEQLIKEGVFEDVEEEAE